MGLRLGVGVRLSRHVGLFYTVPLGHHARRLAGHTGHSGSVLDTLVGLGVMYVIVVVLWKAAVG